MQSLLGQAAGWREEGSEKVMDATSVQVQRMQQRTHNAADNMGRALYAIFSKVWELRRRQGQQYEGSEMQHVRCEETRARLQSCKTENE